MNFLKANLKFIFALGIFFLLLSFLSLISRPATKPENTNQTNDLYLDNVVSKPIERKLVVVISLDGVGSNLLSQTNTPFLWTLIVNNSANLNTLTLTQSETLPSHLSMVTGLTLETHGFRQNSIDSSTPSLNFQTIFDYVKNAGYSYFTFVTKDKLLYLMGDKEGSNIKSIEKFSYDVLEELDNTIFPSSEKVFAFVHFKDVDSVGHTYGWGSIQQLDTLKVLDANLERIISDLADEFNSYERYFIITADHGGEGTQHSNGCSDCRRIPLIVVSENTDTKYKLSKETYNVYDVACIVNDITGSIGQNLECSSR